MLLLRLLLTFLLIEMNIHLDRIGRLIEGQYARHNVHCQIHWQSEQICQKYTFELHAHSLANTLTSVCLPLYLCFFVAQSCKQNFPFAMGHFDVHVHHLRIFEIGCNVCTSQLAHLRSGNIHVHLRFVNNKCTVHN